MYEGTVTRVVIDRGFGFIESTGMPDTFFHCKFLADNLPFDETLQMRRVRFDVEPSPRGPRATSVRAI